MGRTAFTGRQIGEAADVLEAMARDRDCFVVMTLAGAMTVAKQGLVIADLLEHGIVKALVSTGALMAHGLVEATGKAHFQYDPKMNDVELYEAGYNRVYDTLKPETNLDHVQSVVSEILNNWDSAETVCSWKLNQAIGKHLYEHTRGQRRIVNNHMNSPLLIPLRVRFPFASDCNVKTLTGWTAGPKSTITPTGSPDRFCLPPRRSMAAAVRKNAEIDIITKFIKYLCSVRRNMSLVLEHNADGPAAPPNI